MVKVEIKRKPVCIKVSKLSVRDTFDIEWADDHIASNALYTLTLIYNGTLSAVFSL